MTADEDLVPAMKVELLYFDGCPNHERLLPHLHALLREEGVSDTVTPRRIETAEAAQESRFLGSPTVRIDGHDVDPGAGQRDDYGLKCRLYVTDDTLLGTPPDAWVRDAIQRARDRPADAM